MRRYPLFPALYFLALRLLPHRLGPFDRSKQQPTAPLTLRLTILAPHPCVFDISVDMCCSQQLKRAYPFGKYLRRDTSLSLSLSLVVRDDDYLQDVVAAAAATAATIVCRLLFFFLFFFFLFLSPPPPCCWLWSFHYSLLLSPPEEEEGRSYKR